jgi:hypothetical protein
MTTASGGNVDDPQTRIAELRALLDLQADRLWEMQADWAYLREELVKAYAALATLPEEQPAGEQDVVWADHLPK